MASVSELFKRRKYEPCFATGVVNPKTTSLFFDKLWIPDDLAEEYHVPVSIRMDMGMSDRDLSRLYENAILPNQWGNIQENLFSRASNKNVLRSNDLIEMIDVMNHFHKGTMANRAVPVDEIFITKFGSTEKLARQSYAAYVENMRDKDGYLTSFNRNEAIRVITNHYHRIGIDITPIFIEQTDFEKSLLMEGPLDFSKKEYADMKQLYEKIVPKREVDAIAATVKSIPMIVEEELSWNQVKDIRRDKKSVNALRRFRAWASQELECKSQNEVADIIGKELDDYSYALKKHGVLTSVGGFTTMLSTASTIVGALEESQAGLIAAGLAVSAGVITFSAQQLYEYFDTKRQPIAYIYDVIDKAK